MVLATLALIWVVCAFADMNVRCKENCHEEVIVTYDEKGKATLHRTGSEICDGGVFDNCNDN